LRGADRLRIADNCNYFCWALSADALHADRCERRDSVWLLGLRVPLSVARTVRV